MHCNYVVFNTTSISVKYYSQALAIVVKLLLIGKWFLTAFFSRNCLHTSTVDPNLSELHLNHENFLPQTKAIYIYSMQA